MPSNPKVDAILVDHHYPAHARDAQKKLLLRKAEFAPILGSPLAWSRPVPGGKHLITPEPEVAAGVPHTPHFPKGHPHEGKPRYEWQDRGDGVLYGVLVDVSTLAPSDPVAEAKAARQTRRQHYLDSIAAIEAVPEASRTAAQAAELARLEAWFPRLFPEAATNGPS